MKKFNYTTQGVCSTNISFNIDDGRIYNVKFDGGCMGNLQAISKLVEGKSAEEIVGDIFVQGGRRGKGPQEPGQ